MCYIECARVQSASTVACRHTPKRMVKVAEILLLLLLLNADMHRWVSTRAHNEFVSDTPAVYIIQIIG